MQILWSLFYDPSNIMQIPQGVCKLMTLTVAWQIHYTPYIHIFSCIVLLYTHTFTCILLPNANFTACKLKYFIYRHWIRLMRPWSCQYEQYVDFLTFLPFCIGSYSQKAVPLWIRFISVLKCVQLSLAQQLFMGNIKHCYLKGHVHSGPSATSLKSREKQKPFLNLNISLNKM